MSRTLGRNLHMCFTKVKYPPSPQSSIQEQHQHQDDHIHTPNSSSNTILIKNFNTLYDPTITYTSSNSKSTPTSSESDTDTTATPDFATVYASQRFFFSSPGRSNSIIESTSSLSSSSSSSFSPEKRPESDNVVGGGIPIPTFSPDPFLDFRQSMQEMVEARDLMDVRANWEYLHELLTCYLSLNPKSTHKFIVGAFADLLVSLMTSSPVETGRRRRKSGGGCEISRKCIYD